MKVYPKQQLPYAVAGAGMLGGLLRMLLYTRGTDDGGLLIPGHWAAVSLWALTALVMAALILFYSKPVGATLHSPIASALGCFLCAAALAGVTLFQSPGAQTPLDTLIFGLSLAGAAALAYIGICRLRGKQPHYLGHALLCLCFALKMVGQYRTWSADPQLMG